MRFSREVEWNIWESFHTLLKGIFPAKITKECNRICVIKNDAPCWSGVMNRYSALWKQLKKCPWNIFEMSARASKKCHARRHPIVFSCQSYFIKGISCVEFDSARYKRTWRDRRLINYFCHSEAFSLLPIKLCLFFCKISKLFFWQLPRQPDEINTAADRLRQSARFPASLLVCLTSPSLSLSPPNITMHLASPAATVWCSLPLLVFIPPSSPSLSFHPSIYVTPLRGGGALSLSLSSRVKGNHMEALNGSLHCSGCYMISLFLCVWPRKCIPPGAHWKLPRSAIRFPRASPERNRTGTPRENLW